MRPIVQVLGLGAALLLAAAPAAARKTACKGSASAAKKACGLETKSDRSLEEGKCLHSADPALVDACRAAAKAEAAEAGEDCKDQHEARLDLCDALGEDVYDPALDPGSFSSTITNPYAPFAVGSRWVYEKTSDEGVERIEVEVLDETRSITGIEARVVRDQVFLDGVLVEDTDDWLAQDVAGNLWYLGEISKNYENGQLVDVEGSWEHGRDGAKGGFWMKAGPMPGDLYRQEFLLGEAEDVGEVLSLGEEVMVPAGTFPNCLQTADGSPLEPDALEHKFYASGVGLVLEVNVEDGERTELIEYTPAP